MRYSCLTIAISLYLFESLLSTNALADRYSPPVGISDHFDYEARCFNGHMVAAERLNYCQSLIGRGAGRANDASTLYYIGLLYLEMHDYSKAIETFSKAIDYAQTRTALPLDVKKSLARAYGRRAAIYAAAGQYDHAVADRNQMMLLAPDTATSYNSSCWIRAVAGKELGSARADCDEALRQEPDNANYLDSRGFVEFKMADLKTALADYNQAISQNGKLASSLYMRGIIKKRLGDTSGGNTDIEAAQAIDIEIANAYVAYGVTP